MSAKSNRPLALVTGASSPIGFELARRFADNGFDLVVAAQDAGIETAARRLQLSGVEIRPVRVDLTREDGVEQLYLHINETGRPLDVVALNPGVDAGGAFVRDSERLDELRIVDLNVRSTVQLAKYVVRDMVQRGEGRILFTSSIASTMPGPLNAVYTASKSFVQSFALALRNELKDTGVSVTSLIPGPTDAYFFDQAEIRDGRAGIGEADDPADLARDGFDALMAGDQRVVADSFKTRAQEFASRVTPDGVKAELRRRQADPGSAS